jgi:hypothetical protein
MTTPSVRWTPRERRSSLLPRLAVGIALAVAVVTAGYLILGSLGPKYPVSLTITPSVAGRILTIKGETDLRDGAVISYEVWHELRDRQLFPDNYAPTPIVDATQPPTPQILAGSMKVAAGRFAGSVNLTDWPQGNVIVRAYFDPDPEQPPDVRARFGDNNEHLGGPNVVEGSDGLRSAIAKGTVRLP